MEHPEDYTSMNAPLVKGTKSIQNLSMSSGNIMSSSMKQESHVPRSANFNKMRLGQKDAPGVDSADIDAERKRQQAYDYLCHIGEAKEWIEACLKEPLAEIEKLDEELRNGIDLAKLAKLFQPNIVKKIFDDKTKLQFRHSDNINFFLTACRAQGLPEIFFFELTDLYEKKNIPKVIYCIHALSFLLAQGGHFPHIKNLVGTLIFSDEVLGNTAKDLENCNAPMPAFGNISKDFEKEMEEMESEEERIAREKAEQDAERQKAQEWLKLQNQAASKIQATYKARMAKKYFKEKMERFKSNELLFEKIQARIKGKKARVNYIAKKNDYLAKTPSIIKIQAWWRGTVTRYQYKELRLKKGLFDVKLVQKFLHLLEGSNDDDDEEKQVEEMRGNVVQKIRENLAAEAILAELDAKVALLIKNRITVHEVAHLKSKDMRAVLAKNAAQSGMDSGIMTLKGSDKATRTKKKLYSQLLYLLQTQPLYLSNLLFNLNKTSGGNATKFLEQTVLTMFGYAQNNREEFLFLRFVNHCIDVEVKNAESVSEALKDNPMFIKLALQYIRGVKEREFLRGLLRPLLGLVLGEKNLELELNLSAIYKGIIRQEEMDSGEKSNRPSDLTAEELYKIPEVQKLYLDNIEKLKTFTDTFLESIITSIGKMPFGIRYVAMKFKEKLLEKFGSEAEKNEVDRVIGNILYYRYINPVIIAPEAFDVLEKPISPAQRKNLAEVARTLHQIAVGKQDTVLVPPFAKFMADSAPKFSKFLKEASTVVSAEEYFGMDEFYDTGGVRVRLTVYITPDELIQIQHSLIAELDRIAPTAEDPLRIILDDLGAAPEIGSAAKGPGSEVVLQLSNRFGKIPSDNQTEEKKLMKETKRMVLFIIRFCHGASLMDILEQVATPEQEKRMAAYITDIEEGNVGSETRSLGSRNNLNATSQSAIDLSSPDSPTVKKPVYVNPANDSYYSLSQIKIKALENMSILERFGVANKEDKYQSILDLIVADMLNKHRSHSNTHKELLNLRKTMISLMEKSTYLKESAESYHNYIDSCLQQLSAKKAKSKKTPPLFSKQYYHMQSLKKMGAVPKFGSFKYSASELFKKGVLISIDDISQNKFLLITLTISSDESGIFKMSVTWLGATAPETEELRLEDLLQKQYNKEDVITLFDMAKTLQDSEFGWHFEFNKMTILAEEIRNQKGTTLWLTFHGLTGEDMPLVCGELLLSKTFEALNFNGNPDIGPIGAMKLAEVIPQLCNLSNVNLAGCGIGDQGCLALCKALENNQTVTTICLLDNGISCIGAKALSEFILKNSNLQHLYLYKNDIRDKGAMLLAKAISRHAYLETLWLDHNPVSPDCAHKVVDLVVQCKSLLTFAMNAAGELLSKKDQLRIRIMISDNTTHQVIRTRSAIFLIRRRTALLAINPPLPHEIVHQILFSSLGGFSPSEQVTLGTILLDRTYLGKIVPLNTKSAIMGSLLVKRCEALLKKSPKIPSRLVLRGKIQN